METMSHYSPAAAPAARLHRWWLRGVLFEHAGAEAMDADAAAGSGIGDCWGLHIVEGASGGVLLDGLNALIVVEGAPAGAETLAIYIDAEANLLQREALEAILGGRAGGGFEQIAGRVTRRAGTRFVPIAWMDDGTEKSLRVSGVALPDGDAPRHGRKPLPGGSSVPPRLPVQHRSGTVEIRSDGVTSLCSHVFWHGAMEGV